MRGLFLVWCIGVWRYLQICEVLFTHLVLVAMNGSGRAALFVKLKHNIMKRKDLLKAVLILSVLPLSSCASMFCGSKQRVIIESNIESADYVTVDGRKHKSVTFPFEVKMKRGFQDTYVTSEAAGYDKASLYAGKSFNAVTLLNLLFGGIIGLGVDAATGAMTKVEYGTYELEFTPESK